MIRLRSNNKIYILQSTTKKKIFICLFQRKPKTARTIITVQQRNEQIQEENNQINRAKTHTHTSVFSFSYQILPMTSTAHLTCFISFVSTRT